MDRAQFYSPMRVVTFMVALAAALSLALLPIEPERPLPAAGDVPTEPVKTATAIEFTSAALTTRAQEAAAAAVTTFVTVDRGVRRQQITALDSLLAEIDAVRADTTLTDLQRQAALAGIADLQVSPGVQLLLGSLTDSQWRATRDAARTLLADLFDQNILEANVASLRADLRDRLPAALDSRQQDVVADLVSPLLRANVVVDDAATAAARAAARGAVPPVICRFAPGDTLFPAGEPVGGGTAIQHCTLPATLDAALLAPAALGALTAEALGHLTPAGGEIPGDDLVAIVILAIAAAVTIGAYLTLTHPAAAASDRRLVLLGVLILAAVATARWYFPVVLPDERDKALELFVPVGAAAVLTGALLDKTLALVVAGVVAALAGFAALQYPDFGPGQAPLGAQALRPALVFLFSGVAGVFASSRVERVTQHGVTGGVVGGAAFLVGLAFWLLNPDRAAAEIGWLALASAVIALTSGLLTIGAFMFLGTAFGITTRLQLLELAQLTQPLLRRLQEEAPGTFHHSLLVATMAERAANQIGADGLLVRVGCYYHDIGKLAKPHMYIENQAGGKNPHDDLDPIESARVIQEHVHWGGELAKRHHLPERVRAFIPEHHGTRLVTYFYRKAAQKNPDLDSALFTYHGPRPRSRETAIAMLADSCEAVVRSSRDRDIETIDRLVDAVITERLAERQLDDCDLTLRQLRAVGDSFKVTLRGVYHPRIEYPTPTPAEQQRHRPLASLPKGVSAAPTPTGDQPVDGTAPPEIGKRPPRRAEA